MTCVHFGRDQICTKVDASFLPLTHPPHVIPMWVKFICCKGNLLANERQPWTPWNGVLQFGDLFVLASPYGQPTQVCSQVRLAVTRESVIGQRLQTKQSPWEAVVDKKLFVDSASVEKFESQVVTWPAATRVFLPTTKGGRGGRGWKRGCYIASDWRQSGA